MSSRRPRRAPVPIAVPQPPPAAANRAGSKYRSTREIWTELGGTPVEIFLFVEDVDAAVRRAEEAGATVKVEPTDQFWGDRLAQLRDPFGHHWLVASRVEELTPAEIAERGKALFAGAGAAFS